MVYQNAPTAPGERILLLDALRGVAVFGILLANILIFSGFVFTPFSVLEQFDGAKLNHTLYTMSKILISGKFYPVFCILFGYGLFMQTEKFKLLKASIFTFYARRFSVLLLIGLLHQIIWPGDVLTVYAPVAFFVLFFRNASTKQTLLLAIVFFLLYFAIGMYPYVFTPSASARVLPEQIAHFSLNGIDPFQIKEIVQNQGIKGMYRFYAPQYQFIWSASRLLFTTPSVMALFFVGGLLFKIDFLNIGAPKLKNSFVFLLLGGLGTYLHIYVAYPFRIVDNLFLSLFYITVIARLFKSKRGVNLFKPFIPVGKMALTSYVMQSLMCIFAFFGFGLKLFGSLPLYQIYLLALAMLTFQMLFAKIWLKKYCYGPLEWVWRSLSYKSHVPLKISRP